MPLTQEYAKCYNDRSGLAELSFRQIGDIFGNTDNWACVTYHRAVKMIRTRMEDDEK